ncbi:DsbA family oxidoreductase [Solitalea lacus]|uniref:DsbA family oxidoreductase n=1 Tax=Solitalea lacus TaxID=2911172 RepID=UPI001EDAB91E|nr:DsbA family oxidoreductase [Solitalea lacus]UKJ07888.1 DsbA family oxidoreductase [Solitalea lacus]
MKIEVWSDIACPFCYIGKRRLENALADFPDSDKVEVIWRSFELDPNANYEKNKDHYTRLAEKYGRDREWAVQMSENVTAMAAEEGLEFDFNKNIPANTFDAHRLIHLAQKNGFQDAAKERLLKAHFSEGKDIAHHPTLVELGAEIGLKEDEVKRMLESDEFGYDVRVNEQEAQQIGVKGVPFFVFNRKYGVSGAQPLEVFTETLNKAWAEVKPVLDINQSTARGVCTPEGSCEI